MVAPAPRLSATPGEIRWAGSGAGRAQRRGVRGVAGSRRRRRDEVARVRSDLSGSRAGHDRDAGHDPRAAARRFAVVGRPHLRRDPRRGAHLRRRRHEVRRAGAPHARARRGQEHARRDGAREQRRLGDRVPRDHAHRCARDPAEPVLPRARGRLRARALRRRGRGHRDAVGRWRRRRVARRRGPGDRRRARPTSRRSSRRTRSSGRCGGSATTARRGRATRGHASPVPAELLVGRRGRGARERPDGHVVHVGHHGRAQGGRPHVRARSSARPRS